MRRTHLELRGRLSWRPLRRHRHLQGRLSRPQEFDELADLLGAHLPFDQKAHIRFAPQVARHPILIVR